MIVLRNRRQALVLQLAPHCQQYCATVCLRVGLNTINECYRITSMV